MRFTITAATRIHEYAEGCATAVVEKFGGSFTIDLVAFLSAGPVEADRVAGVFDVEAGLQGAEGDFAALRGDRQPRRAQRSR